MEVERYCVRCGQPGMIMFPPYWMHDRDADAYRCPLGNNWVRCNDGTVIPWPQWHDRRGTKQDRRQT